MPQQHQDFQRTIGLSTATALVITTIIGSGIFMRPAEMAALLGSPYFNFFSLDHCRSFYYAFSDGISGGSCHDSRDRR